MNTVEKLNQPQEQQTAWESLAQEQFSENTITSEKSSENTVASEQSAENINETAQIPAFPDDPRQYTESELMADPAKRFHVNPADFPLFSRQGEKSTYSGPLEAQNLDKTLGRYVRNTADLIATIAGEAEDNPIPYDHIIYLDKSARPVSWLVNIFWNDFSESERPPHSYLAIDRGDWFKNVGLNTTADGRLVDEDQRLANFSDFKKEADKLPDDTFARIRALYIPEGITSEDPAEIMDTPTPLDGKRILVVDEVGRTGSTQKIAQYLLQRAFPNADTTVETTEFWDPKTVVDPISGETEMASAPVWYSNETEFGRGIGDADIDLFERRYQEYPTAKNRARLFGAEVLGAPINLAEEPGRLSRNLAEEMQKMHQEYQSGHILMLSPDQYNQEKWIEHCESRGVTFHPADSPDSRPSDYIKIIAKQT